MKKMSIIAVALLTIAVASPAIAGENIYANGTITLAANVRTNTQTVGLYNNSGQEWGLVRGFRAYFDADAGVTGTVTVACTDLYGTNTLLTLVMTNDTVRYANVMAEEYSSSSSASTLLTYGNSYALMVITNTLIGYDGSAAVTNEILTYAIVPTQTITTNTLTTVSTAPSSGSSVACRSILVTLTTSAASTNAQSLSWGIFAE